MFASVVLLAATVGTALALPAAHPSAHLMRRGDVLHRNFIIAESCQTGADLEHVKKAIDGMYQLVQAATTSSASNYAYKTWMDPDSNEMRHAVTMKRFQTLLKVASPTEDFSRKVRMICDPTGKKIRECIAGATAAVNTDNRGEHFERGTNGGEMFLCPKFLNPDTTPQLKFALKKCMDDPSNRELANYRNSANALLHEMTHLRIFMSSGTSDCMYGPATTRGLASKAPWISMLNADSYSYMALAAFLLKHDQCSQEMIATRDGSSGGLDNSEKKGYEQCKLDGSGLTTAMKKEHLAPSTEDEEERMRKQLEALGLGESGNAEMNSGKDGDLADINFGTGSRFPQGKKEAKKSSAMDEPSSMPDNARTDPPKKDMNLDSPRPSNKHGPDEMEKFAFEDWSI